MPYRPSSIRPSWSADPHDSRRRSRARSSPRPCRGSDQYRALRRNGRWTVNPSADTDARYLDGNALGGPLAELFAPDITTAMITCAHCGAQAALATYQVYPDAPALVVCCPGCAGVVM